MARYYSYGRRRYGRRYYRRGYRRYGGSSLRRYRSVQMNDNETKVMTFSSVCDFSVTFSGGTATARASPFSLLQGGEPSGLAQITPSAGRPFFAGMMFDRMRFRSLSVTLRPKVMPSSSATNYVVYAAWDRYGQTQNPLIASYSIRTDPSAKQVVWTPGGSGTSLRTWIYATNRDRYQYMGITHATNLASWGVDNADGSALEVFYPMLLIALEAVVSTSTTVQFSVHSRIVVEFQGGFSSTTLNPSAVSASDTVEQRKVSLQRMYNSNPADNNDDFVSVLNELSNPQ